MWTTWLAATFYEMTSELMTNRSQKSGQRTAICHFSFVICCFFLCAPGDSAVNLFGAAGLIRVHLCSSVVSFKLSKDAVVEIISAVILGVVQGLTDLLPISSPAHLIVVHRLLGWEAQGLVFDVALHVGTSAAILAYFWRDWIDLAREMLLGIRERQLLGNAQRRLACFLIVGTLPSAAAGLAFKDYIETHL